LRFAAPFGHRPFSLFPPPIRSATQRAEGPLSLQCRSTFLSINKADLIAILVDRWGVNKREASDLVDTMFAIITERMLAGEYGRFNSLL
jgi:hypothetical protein